MIIDRIVKAAPAGTAIPKPAARGVFRVKGTGTRRGQPALIYTIPNHAHPTRGVLQVRAPSRAILIESRFAAYARC